MAEMTKHTRLLALALLLAGCSQEQSLQRQFGLMGGYADIAYDVRPASPAVYEAAVAFSYSHNKEKDQIARSLLLKGLTRVKEDGYDLVVVKGPYNAPLTTKMAVLHNWHLMEIQRPGLQYTLSGYKVLTGAAPADAVDTSAQIAQLRAQGTKD